MNIALIGYGKMGHAIEQAALKRGHHIILRITSANRDEMTEANLSKADVAIEFTNAAVARENVMQCLSAGLSVVCGTTGWNDGLSEVGRKAVQSDLGFIHASNFRVGVNIFFEVNKLLASLMNGRTDYDVSVEETHHTQKKDAPSGTAITLAEQIIEQFSNKKQWALNDVNDSDAVPIIAHRVENVPGTHKVSYSSSIDTIDIIHTAHSRDGFALGAVLAAEYVYGRRGVFTMKEVLFGH